MPLSDDQMKTKIDVVTVVTKPRSGVFEWCVTSPLHVKCFFVSSQLILCFSFEAAVWCNDGTSIEDLFKEETEQALLEELPDSDPYNSSSNGRLKWNQ